MVGALLGGAIAGGLGNLFSGAMDQVYRWNDNNWQSPLDATIQLKNLDKDISDYFLDKQIAYNKYVLGYNKEMSNSAYQRALADMKAAGINPASLAGINASAAQTPSVPGVSAAYHSGSQAITPQRYGDSLFGSSMLNSAMNAAIAKDKNVANLMAAEIVDNARHEHRLEELREKHQMNLARDFENSKNKYKYHNEKEAAQADYYSALTNALYNK